MKTCFLTGSSGFIGSRLCPKLREAGYFIIGADPAGPDGPYEGGLNVRYTWRGLTFPDGTVNVGSKETAREITPDCESYEYAPEHTYRPDLCIHLAANIKSVDKRMAGGLDAYQDIMQDYEFLKWCEIAKPGRVVLMSSCAVDTQDDPYGFCKVALEKFAAKLTVPHVVLRPYSGFGENQSLDYPVPAIIDRALRDESPLTYWGSPHTVRDFIYVSDLVDAIVLAATDAKWLAYAQETGPIEVGTGAGVSMLQLVTEIARATGRPDVDTCSDPSKPASSPTRVANTVALHELGWRHKVSLEEGIRRTVEWAKA